LRSCPPRPEPAQDRQIPYQILASSGSEPDNSLPPCGGGPTAPSAVEPAAQRPTAPSAVEPAAQRSRQAPAISISRSLASCSAMVARTPSVPYARSTSPRASANSAKAELCSPNGKYTKLPWLTGRSQPCAASAATTRERS